MDKNLLIEYIDACEMVKETEQDIKRLGRKKKRIVQESVKGSNPEFPYNAQHFHVEGTPFTYQDDQQLRYEEKLLTERKNKAEKIKQQVERYINTIPVRMQRIIRYRLFDGLSWDDTAVRMGRKATADSVRKELERFLEEK